MPKRNPGGGIVPGSRNRRSDGGSDHSSCGDRPDDNQCGRLPGAHLQGLRSFRNIVDYRSPLRRSAASDSDADTEPEHERHAESHWVNKWNEARSRLGDLKSPDRASAHTSAASASGSISRSLWAQARPTTSPKAIPHAGDWDYRPSTSTDGFAIYISYARTNLQMIAQRA